LSYMHVLNIMFSKAVSFFVNSCDLNKKSIFTEVNIFPNLMEYFIKV